MTNAELAILSLIAEQPRHGYEVEQVIDARGMREWTEVGFSSIYYLLNKLERQGLVAGRLDHAVRGPARKVYSLTPSGGKRLHDAVLRALSEPQSAYPAILLGLASLPAVSTADALTALHRYEQALASHLGRLQSKQAAQQPLPYFVNAVFEHGTASLKAELAWTRAFIQQLEETHGKA
jgi:DNA-binding PadR family transcriptional regulator